MKTDLLKDKSKEEISEIWREYHSNKDAVSAVIPAEMFEKMSQKFSEFKTVNFKKLYKSVRFLKIEFSFSVSISSSQKGRI